LDEPFAKLINKAGTDTAINQGVCSSFCIGTIIDGDKKLGLLLLTCKNRTLLFNENRSLTKHLKKTERQGN